MLVFAVLFIVCVGIVFVFRRAPVIISPLIKESPTYDLAALLEKNGMTSTTPVLTNGAIVASVSGILVSFSQTKDLAQQVRALQLVLPKVKMDERKVVEIDLRFNKVVIKYQP